jgi:CelD/BcsL family acetyltransferase involved in cellulose biosynthesis
MLVPASSDAEAPDRRCVHPPQRPVATEIVSTLSGFASLESEWNALARRAAAPWQVFQDFSVLRHWALAYAEEAGQPTILVLRRDGRAAAILPLVRRRRFGLAGLHLMGAPVARFGDLLAEDDPDGALAAALRAAIGTLGADYLDAALVRDDSALVRLGLDRGAIVVGRQQAPFADLARRVGPDGPGEIYPAKVRSNHRRRLRRMADAGDIVLSGVGPGAEAEALAQRAIAMKKAWLLRENLAAPSVFDPRFEAFFARFAAETGGLASLNVSTLMRDGEPFAIDLSFDFKGHAFGHVIATGCDAEKDGAGGILVHHVFANAKARGNTIFELLTPSDEHKMRHTDGVTGVRDLLIPLSLAGRIGCETLLARGLPAAKAIAQRLPAGLARAIALRTGY